MMRPPWPVAILTMMFSNSSTSSSRPATLTGNWKLWPAGAGGMPIWPAGDLEVLLLDGADDVARVEAEGLEHLGVKPDPHAVLADAEDGHVAHARQPRDHVAQVDPGVVAQEQAVVAAVGGVEVDDLQDGGGHLLGDGPLLLHVEGQLGHGGGDAVLDQHLGHVEVGADLEGDDELVGAVAGARGLHVEHVLDAVDLLLDRQRDGVGHDPGARPGVGGRDLHGGRGDLGVLGDGQPEHRTTTRG